MKIYFVNLVERSVIYIIARTNVCDNNDNKEINVAIVCCHKPQYCVVTL